MRAARTIVRTKVYANGARGTKKEHQPTSPILKGGLRPFKKLALHHGVPLKKAFGPRNPDCDPLCVNPFHRSPPAPPPPDLVDVDLVAEIKAFMPNVTTEDDIYDEFGLRGHSDDDILEALERIRANSNT